MALEFHRLSFIFKSFIEQLPQRTSYLTIYSYEFNEYEYIIETPEYRLSQHSVIQGTRKKLLAWLSAEYEVKDFKKVNAITTICKIIRPYKFKDLKFQDHGNMIKLMKNCTNKAIIESNSSEFEVDYDLLYMWGGNFFKKEREFEGKKVKEIRFDFSDFIDVIVESFIDYLYLSGEEWMEKYDKIDYNLEDMNNFLDYIQNEAFDILVANNLEHKLVETDNPTQILNGLYNFNDANVWINAILANYNKEEKDQVEILRDLLTMVGSSTTEEVKYYKSYRIDFTKRKYRETGNIWKEKRIETFLLKNGFEEVEELVHPDLIDDEIALEEE